MAIAKKSDRARAAILAAAQRLFAERGYEGATVRDIAADASIDPAMVIRYFGSKEDLFARAAAIELELPRLDKVARARIGTTLLEHFLDLWEGEGQGKGMTVLLRSAASNEFAAAKMRETFTAQVMPLLRAVGNAKTAEQRAGLISSQLMGLAMSRYILLLPPVVAMSREEILEWVGPTLQRYATEV